MLNDLAVPHELPCIICALAEGYSMTTTTADVLRCVRELRTEGDGMPTLVGQFAVFDQWTQIDSMHEGHFMERVNRGSMTALASFPAMMRRDRKREGLRVGRAAWLLGVSVREYREIEAGPHAELDTYQRLTDLYGWPQTFVGRSAP